MTANSVLPNSETPLGQLAANQQNRQTTVFAAAEFAKHEMDALGETAAAAAVSAK